MRHEEQAKAAHDRTDEEIGGPPAEAGIGPVAQRADQRLDQQSRHRSGQLENGEGGFIRAQPGIDGHHIALLQAKAELQAKEAEVHFDDAQQ